jgi:hypothetical protein
LERVRETAAIQLLAENVEVDFARGQLEHAPDVTDVFLAAAFREVGDLPDDDVFRRGVMNAAGAQIDIAFTTPCPGEKWIAPRGIEVRFVARRNVDDVEVRTAFRWFSAARISSGGQ